jgi:hypothetical protein
VVQTGSERPFGVCDGPVQGARCLAPRGRRTAIPPRRANHGRVASAATPFAARLDRAVPRRGQPLVARDADVVAGNVDTGARRGMGR